MSVEERTDQILDAVERLLGRGGISAVTSAACLKAIRTSARPSRVSLAAMPSLLAACWRRFSGVMAWPA